MYVPPKSTWANNTPVARDPEDRWHKPQYARTIEAGQPGELRDRWSAATDSLIDEEIELYGTRTRIKSTHETRNSPIVKGVIRSHTTAVVGAEGPTLDLQATDDNAANDRWCDEAEKIWQEWTGTSTDFTIGTGQHYSRCEASGQLRYADLLTQWVSLLWTCGNFLGVSADDPDAPADDPIGWRIMNLHPSRLIQPEHWLSEPRTRLGVRKNKLGRPVGYWISNDRTPYKRAGSEFPAWQVYHGFLADEPEQTIGLPLMATCIDPAGAIRDYDGTVLRAARAAAGMALFAFTTHNDSQYYEPGRDERQQHYADGALNYMAPGWQLGSLQSRQPTANYKEHRTERMAEIGRPVSMPGLVVRQDASGHNYSSARFDYAQFIESIKVFQAWLTWNTVERHRREVITTAVLNRVLAPPPQGITAVYTWPRPQPIDELKSADAEAAELENGTLSFTEACKRRGTTAQRVVLQRKKDKKLLEAAGLPNVGPSEDSKGKTGKPRPATNYVENET